MKKVLIIIFLFSASLFFSFAEELTFGSANDAFQYAVDYSCGVLDSVDDSLDSIQSSVNSIRNRRDEALSMIEADFDYFEQSGGDIIYNIPYDYSDIYYLLNGMPLNSLDNKISSAKTTIANSQAQLRSYTISVPSSSSSVDMGIITNIYNVLAVEQNNLQSILIDISNDVSDMLNDIGSISGGSTNVVDLTPVISEISKVSSQVNSFRLLFNSVFTSVFGHFNLVEQWQQDQYDLTRLFYHSFLEWSSLVTNFNNNSSFDSSIISNFFGRPNNKYSFDRFASKLRPTNSSLPIDFTFKAPYDSLQNINAANFSALLAGGFSNGLIELASINNYLYYVEKFLTTNQIDNAKINESLYALSNMVGRIDSYVTEDFSNEFFNLCRTIEGLTNSFDSVLGTMTNSNNDLNLSLTNIEISLETIITNQLKSLSFYSAFSNQFNTVISNQTLFSDYLFNSDNVLTEYTDGSYYDFLTNRYITGSNGSISNWYDRIETLLAALTFSAVSQSNLTTQVDNEDDLKQRFQDILTQSVNENTQTSIIKTANDSQGAIINIVRGLSSTISSVASQHSIVFGWGDNETVKFEDFVGGNFHITVSGHGVDQFTMVGRAVSTLCWIVVTCLLVFKFSLWMARVGYKLYTFIRSVLFALWGK